MPSFTNYPDAHLIGLPFELRELILDYLTADPIILRQKHTPLHISAVSPPPLALLLAHSTLYEEALQHFYSRTTLILHIDTYVAATRRTSGGDSLLHLVKTNPHIPHIRRLEIRPRLTADVEFLNLDVYEAVQALVEEGKKLKVVRVGWAESTIVFMGKWRPWAYKSMALDPLRAFVGRVEIETGEVEMPPPRFRKVEQRGLERAVARIIQAGREGNGSSYAEQTVLISLGGGCYQRIRS